ncbi:MAG TPA: ATP-binding cassette domain-containing protein [Streptosporangiaceae bacterium]|nr:ATP-binding cassette domain-containing protein [Streptosporangiaceae bacterium]HXZ63357.1 ATP-binding cassette domain-containing protein [Streptosporangiaceae bacterium]
MTAAIRAEGLVKSFGKTRALAGVDLAAEVGTVLGVLGPNGAGKTTAVRILTTLLVPDGGRAEVGGFDVVRDAHRVRGLIGLTGQYASVDDGLTGTNNLVMIGRLLGLSRAAAKARARELLARFDLSDAAARPVKTYSGGMRRRIDLAASLVGRPQVLFLDEPTTGLDPQGRSDVWDMIRLLAADGVTVLLTTQYLDEADQLARDIAVIDRGRVIATGTPDELKARVGGQVLEVEPADPATLPDVATVLARWVGTESVSAPDARQVSARVPSAAVLPGIVRQLDESGIELAEFSLHKSSLDEVFLTLTGHRAEAGPAADAARPAREVTAASGEMV